MTDELQTESIEDEGTVESGAELAPATGENQDKNEDGDKLEAQEKAQKAINKQHAKYRQEERLRLAAEQEAKELKDKLQALEAEKGNITIPDMPDPYDDDFEEKVKAREDAIRQKAAHEAQQKFVTEQQNATVEAAQKSEQEYLQSLVNGYETKIVTLGLDKQDIKNAGDKVIEYGISEQLAEFILKHEDGPLITKHLADNPVELDDLRTMNPIDAAFKINADIVPAASLLKPQASNAPDPAETLSGRGAGEQVSPLIKGATFE